MFTATPERQMHWVRWVLPLGWGVIIASLFYDPWTVALTAPDHPWSPLRVSADGIPVQGQCVVAEPYALGTTLFWGMVVPSAIFMLLIFGHDLWRRICPLSFLSQIPQFLFDGIILFASTLWLVQSWGRNPVLYACENLAS